MNNLHTHFYFLLVYASFSFGMEEPHNIPPLIKQAIINAPSIDDAASVFNESIERNALAPTVANARWCIYTLADKAKNHAPQTLFTIASKLNQKLASAWLAQYMLNPHQFATVRSTLQETIEANNPQLAAFLLSNKSRELSNSSSSNCYSTAIYRFAYYSITYARNEILMRLLEAGSDITYLEGASTWAPIHIAAWRGNYGAIQLFINRGQNPDFLCREGKTALFHICTQGSLKKEHLASAFLLIDHGANINIIPTQHPKKKTIETNLNLILEEYYRKKRIS